MYRGGERLVERQTPRSGGARTLISVLTLLAKQRWMFDLQGFKGDEGSSAFPLHAAAVLCLYLDIKYLDVKIYVRMQNITARKKGTDTSGTHLWLVMMKAYRALERVAYYSIESSDSCLSDFAVMEMLLHKGPQPVNEIGRRIDLTSGAITTAVDRLESRGFVTREAHENDRRARIVRLTARGKEQAVKVFAAHKTAMDVAASGLSKTERATLIPLLRKLGTSAAGSAAPKERRRT